MASLDPSSLVSVPDLLQAFRRADPDVPEAFWKRVRRVELLGESGPYRTVAVRAKRWTWRSEEKSGVGMVVSNELPRVALNELSRWLESHSNRSSSMFPRYTIEESIDREPCSSCRAGASRSICVSCDGSGRASLGAVGVCPKCDGVGRVFCSQCSNHGWFHSYMIADLVREDCVVCLRVGPSGAIVKRSCPSSTPMESCAVHLDAVGTLNLTDSIPSTIRHAAELAIAELVQGDARLEKLAARERRLLSPLVRLEDVEVEKSPSESECAISYEYRWLLRSARRTAVLVSDESGRSRVEWEVRPTRGALWMSA
jgi:hypothetical protein